MISSIRLRNVIPEIFASNGLPHKHSDVWMQDIRFLKGGKYLVEAESGTGKTSMCAYIAGMRHDYNGTIYFDHEDIKSFSADRWASIRRNNIAWLPQEIGLFGNLTLLENLLIKNCLTAYFEIKKLKEFIERVGLADKIHTPTRLLSMGQQQRVAFIRMLCQPADFFLMDEPVSHLDYGNNIALTGILEEELVSRGAGLIVTSVGMTTSNKDFTTITL